MMAAFPIPSFDPDFASNADWAAMYRACGMQVVPARYPMRTKEDKRPDLSTWGELHNPPLAPDAAFARWFHPRCAPNMGLVSGRASRNAFVIDLDEHTKPEAALWWRGVLEINAMGIEPETWKQTTGGGGRQLVFEAPPDWHAPTNRTSMGVDIRGQGGFAMLPPSVHLSGVAYAWDDGFAPWECELCPAPDWLLEAVDDLVAQHGGDTRGETKAERVQHSGADFDAFGARVDGREDAMSRWAFKTVLELYRKTGGVLPEDRGEAHFAESGEHWLRSTKTRLQGVDNAEGLERECRGSKALAAKCRRLLSKWDSKVAEEANKERPFADRADASREDPAADFSNAKAPPNGELFEFLDVKAIKSMPDPSWLIDGLVVEESLGFIFGPPGCLKTFIALGMGLSFSVGMPDWWGRQIQRQGAVVYISSEGQADLKFRIQAWEQTNQVLADESPFYLIRQTINFMKVEDIGKLLATVEAIAAIANVPIAAVFVDTVSRVLPGADENLQKDMTLFVSACDAVRQRFKATVIGVHHTSRNGNMRGSTVFAGAGDFLVEVSREEGAKHGSIRAAKIKAAEDGWDQAFKVETVSLGDIAGNTSLVVSPAGVVEEEKAPDGGPDRQKCREILDALRRAWDSGKPWSSYPQSKRDGRYMPMLLADFGVGAKQAVHLMEAWLANGVISVEIRNTNTKTKGLKVAAGID
ncbi:AAA family ATPase [Methylobacterium brachiatum]|uniref:AAA family ATPase n=1 Tax=Methylobacterium brachiatum TaxID=269660 RepID=UPI000EFD81D1|nr:AAA family ATPase [Methylobacterium brachiatum]AYO83599.1 hypothetical protein EBB05_15870 [Methylobacterium brachiatum]